MTPRSIRKGSTRREIAGMMFWNLAAGLVGCSKPTQGAMTDLQEMADQQELAILSLVAVDYGIRTDLSGRTVAGAGAGRIVLRDRPYSIAVSAEGEWIAWDNWSARPEPEGIGAKLLVILATTSPPTRSLTFDSWFGGPLAISSKAEHLALIKGVTGQKQPYSLVVADTAAARVEHDVTDLVTRFPLARAVRLGLSGSGNRLVVGSAEWFTVIDLPSRKSVYEARGRYPSLSPDGEFLAFVDQDRRVFLRALSTRSGRILRGRSGSVDESGRGARTDDTCWPEFPGRFRFRRSWLR